MIENANWECGEKQLSSHFLSVYCIHGRREMKDLIRLTEIKDEMIRFIKY